MASQGSTRADRGGVDGRGSGGGGSGKGGVKVFPHQKSSRKVPAPRPPSRWSRMRNLWQMPLLVFSLALFGVAAWLFIDPKPGLSIDQKIDVARDYLSQLRPEAALEQLNLLLAKEKLEKDREAEIHLLLAESLELAEAEEDEHSGESSADYRADADRHRGWGQADGGDESAAGGEL